MQPTDQAPRQQSEAAGRFRGWLRQLFAKVERLLPAEWAEKNISIPATGMEAHPGEVKLSRTPWAREIMDSAADPSVRDIVFVAGTRMGKTFILRLLWCWYVVREIVPVLWVNDSAATAADLSRDEIMPLIEHNKCLRDRRPRGWKKLISSLRMRFPGASCAFVGSNSRGQLAGKSFVVVMANETDKYSGDGVEASSAELLRERTKSFPARRKHFFASSPSTQGGPIWIEFLQTDQRKWHVACRACGEWHAPVWEDIRYDKQLIEGSSDIDAAATAETARYMCPSCKAEHNQKQFTEISLAGKFIPTAVARNPAARGFYVFGLCSPFITMREAVVKFFESRRPGAMWEDKKGFWNNFVGLPWLDEISEVTIEKLAHLRRDYAPGFLPEGFKADVIILSYDVQKSSMPWVLRAWKYSGESYLIDCGEAGTWDDLEHIQDVYGAHYVIGDGKYPQRAPEQREQVWRRAAKNWCIAEGHEVSKNLVTPGRVPALIGGRGQASGATIEVLHVSTYHFKVELERLMSTHAREDQRWFVPTPPVGNRDLAQQQTRYFRELLGEKRQPRKDRKPGLPEFQWIKVGDNHSFDCEVYNIALWRMLSMRRSTALENATQQKPRPKEFRLSI